MCVQVELLGNFSIGTSQFAITFTKDENYTFDLLLYSPQTGSAPKLATSPSSMRKVISDCLALKVSHISKILLHSKIFSMTVGLN